jgi:hypothetical protein
MAENEAGAGALTARTRDRLVNTRRALLRLHLALLESERLTYERGRGRVGGSGEFLQLVINDPWFAWLRPLSEIIVRLDEMLEHAHETTEDDALGALRQAAALVSPAGGGGEFARRYQEALQRSPDVVLAHSGASKSLRPPVEAEAMAEAEIDDNLQGTFPASDPPSWTLGSDHRSAMSADGAERVREERAPGESPEEA